MADAWQSRRRADQRSTNPFSPTFGTAPPVLAGRADTLSRVREAVETGPHHPDYTLLVTGPRGSGKTAVLNALEGEAERASWPTISVSASTPGLCQRIAQAASAALDGLSKPKPKLSSVSAVGFSASWETPASAEPGNLRATLTALASSLDGERLGALLTVDELQAADRHEARELTATVQHVTRRERHPLLFVCAALPTIEEELLADPGMTFFQRCARAHLDPLSDEDAAEALRQPIQERGSRISEQALTAAVAAASGYPFMVQLVGYHSWESSADPALQISTSDVIQGIARADAALIDQVVKPTWVSLSAMDQQFLIAMTKDDGPSHVSVIAERINRTDSYARTYRGRLIKADVITSAGRGYVRFKHRALRNWLHQQHTS